jgi:shikimate dehydrogenase
MRLALIGKNISHSKSPEVYKEILGEKLQSYELLDYTEEILIPSLKEIFLKFDGVSITSPYKTHFLSEVNLVNCPVGVAGINAVRFFNNVYEGTNTDFIAIKVLLEGFKNILKDKKVVILGDGVMSKITEQALQVLGIEYNLFSRKQTTQFDQLIFENNFIINTCSRDYTFLGNIRENVVFWDFNYNFLPHEKLIPTICSEYISGLSLLESQAKYAVLFWSGSNSLKSL